MGRSPLTNCPKCGRVLPLKGKKGPRCRPCGWAYLKAWRLANKEKVRANNKRYKIENPELVYRKQREDKWKEQGIKITYDEYLEKAAAQNNRCIICNRESGHRRKGLCVDHKHSTGLIRDLLCHKCNTAVGFMESENFPLYIAYLEKWRESS